MSNITLYRYQLKLKGGSSFFTLYMLYSESALKVYSNMCCSLRITYVQGLN